MVRLRFHSLALAIATLGLLTVGQPRPASADLEPRSGGQAVYDTDRDITWLADANLAASQDFGIMVGSGIPGRFNDWDEAISWVAAMNAASYLGVSTWRLPSVQQPDPTCDLQDPIFGSTSTNCTGSEMGHLFYLELSGTAGQPISLSGDPDLALFSNLQDSLYWSGTEFANPSRAYDFGFVSGAQFAGGKSNAAFGWPVVDGDVFATATVPALPGPALVVLVGALLSIGMTWLRPTLR